MWIKLITVNTLWMHCRFCEQTLTSVKLKKSPTPPRIFRASVAWYSIISPQVEHLVPFLHDWCERHKKRTWPLVFTGMNQLVVSSLTIIFHLGRHRKWPTFNWVWLKKGLCDFHLVWSTVTVNALASCNIYLQSLEQFIILLDDYTTCLNEWNKQNTV